MEFYKQEYWSRLPFPSPGALPTQGLNLGLLHCWQTLYQLSNQGEALAFHNNYRIALARSDFNPALSFAFSPSREF